MTMTTTEDLALELVDQIDGKPVAGADGFGYRLCSEPDDLGVADVGTDWYGALAEVDWRSADYPHRPRPDGFDGNAEILRLSYGNYWWQPPPDVPRDKGWDSLSVLRRNLIDLLEYGYRVLILERLDGTDAYGRPVVVGYASIGGIEPFADRDWLADLAADLLAELNTDREER